jgi:hypothetical protein
MEQLTMFDIMYENFKITKKIRLIELFARQVLVRKQWP